MLKLTQIKCGHLFKICKIYLDSCYFKSIGIGIEDKIQVIRKAPFNGALHVKNNLGAEFAIDYQTAESIYVIEI
jgi:Fe2+ transport system protein FeoA